MLARWAPLLLWRTLALACVALGIVGAFLPVLPATPFLLVAAWAGSKGWPRLEAWLVGHRRWGPPIARWRDHGAVPRSAKWAASGTMAMSMALLWWSRTPLALQLALPVFLAAVAGWLWRRPEV